MFPPSAPKLRSISVLTFTSHHSRKMESIRIKVRRRPAGPQNRSPPFSASGLCFVGRIVGGLLPNTFVITGEYRLCRRETHRQESTSAPNNTPIRVVVKFNVAHQPRAGTSFLKAYPWQARGQWKHNIGHGGSMGTRYGEDLTCLISRQQID